MTENSEAGINCEEAVRKLEEWASNGLKISLLVAVSENLFLFYEGKIDLTNPPMIHYTTKECTVSIRTTGYEIILTGENDRRAWIKFLSNELPREMRFMVSKAGEIDPTNLSLASLRVN